MQDKLSRETHINVLSWLHLPQPKLENHVGPGDYPILELYQQQYTTVDIPSLRGRWWFMSPESGGYRRQDNHPSWWLLTIVSPAPSKTCWCERFPSCRKLRTLPSRSYSKSELYHQSMWEVQTDQVWVHGLFNSFSVTLAQTSLP